jgi:hypothetical protein
MAPRPVLAQASGLQIEAPGTLIRGDTTIVKPSSPVWSEVTDRALEGCVGQNILFDLAVLAQHCISIDRIFEALDAGKIHSVDIRQRLLNIARGMQHKGVKYNLGAIAHVYGLEADKSNPWRLRFAELEEIPFDMWPADALDYAFDDADVPVQVFQRQEEIRADYITDYGIDPLADEKREMRAAFAFHLVAAHGVVTDGEALEYYRDWLEDRARDARKKLINAGLLYLKGGKYSKRQKLMREIVVKRWTERSKWGFTWLKDYLDFTGESVTSFRDRTDLDQYDIEQIWQGGDKFLGLPAHKASIVSAATEGEYVPYPRTDSGKYPQLDDASAVALDLPELYLWREYCSAESGRNRYNELTVPVVHTKFKLAKSGRHNTSGPNISNRPRKGPDRECFAPEQGVYLITDHDQLELSTIAQVLIVLGCGDNLAQAINSGQDGHIILAAEILGISYDDAKQRHLAGDPEVKQWRQVAKAANFGFAGGLGAPSFTQFARGTYGVTVTLDTAKRVREAWFSAWPEMRRYFKKIGNVVRRGDPIVQLYSGRVRGGCGFTDGCNTLFQGLGGDLTSAVLYELQRACYGTPVAYMPDTDCTDIDQIAKKNGWTVAETCNVILYGCRTENYIHDEYLLAVPEDKYLTLRARAKERIVIGVAEQWLPDMKPTATATAARRWSKAAREVRDIKGSLVTWEVCPEVDQAVQYLGQPEKCTLDWSRSVASSIDDPTKAQKIAIDAALTRAIRGYRQPPKLDRALEIVANVK